MFARLASPAVPAVAWHPLRLARPAGPVAISVEARVPPGRAASPVILAGEGPGSGRTGGPAGGGSDGRAALAPETSLTATLSAWPAVFLAAWTAGFAAGLVRLAVRRRRARRAVRGAEPVTDPAVLTLWQACRAGRGPRARLLRTPAGIGPGTWGVWRPAVLLPPEALALPRADLRCVLLHEAAHLRRRDAAFGAAVSLLCVVHWFNPAAWWAAAGWRAAREEACDAAALDALAPADRPAYGRLVLRFTTSFPRPACAAPILGAGFGAPPVARRVMMIASHEPPTRRRRLAAAVALVACAALGLTAAGPPDADVPPTESPAGSTPPPVAENPPAGGTPAEEPAGGDAEAIPTPCYVTGPVRDARTGDPLTNTADGRPIRVVATAPGGFRAVGDLNDEGTFRIRVPRARVRLTTDPPLPLVGTQDTADETDAIGAVHVFGPDQVGQIATLVVLPTWPTGAQPVPEERDAVAAVEALGGSVELDDAGRVVEINFAPWWRTGWGWSDGPDGPRENAVSFTTGADVAPLLGRFPHLRHVEAQGRQITDAGLAAASPLPELRSLTLAGSGSEEAFTVEGLRTLFAAAPKLETIVVDERGPAFEEVLAESDSLRRAIFIGPPPNDGSGDGFTQREVRFPRGDAADAAP